MRRASMCVVLLLLCYSAVAELQKQKVTVQGKLVRMMAIGGESTGWAIQLDPDDRPVVLRLVLDESEILHGPSQAGSNVLNSVISVLS